MSETVSELIVAHEFDFTLTKISPLFHLNLDSSSPLLEASLSIKTREVHCHLDNVFNLPRSLPPDSNMEIAGTHHAYGCRPCEFKFLAEISKSISHGIGQKHFQPQNQHDSLNQFKMFKS